MSHFSFKYRAAAVILCLAIFYSTAWTQQAFTDADYEKRNAENLEESKAVKKQSNSSVIGIESDYNHILFYGQSLSVGADSKIPISITPKPGNVMVGNTVNYELNREKVFSPLTAAGGEGEPPVVGTVNFFRKLYLDQKGSDASKSFIASSCGVSGRSIEQLSKDALGKKHWNKVIGAVKASKELSDAAKKTYSITAFCWMQGESNYNPNSCDWTGTKDGYKEKFVQMRNALVNDCAKEIAKQEKPPIFLTYQTGGAYSNDTNFLSIGMAQWEMTQETPDCYMATPAYPFTDYGGHLTANGYRWIGAQFAKVLNKILLQHEGWKPLSPRKLLISGRTISIDFHVPEPPLVFDSPYVGRKKAELKDNGFSVFDADGNVPIESMRLVKDTIVEIVCKRDVIGNVYVRHATKTGTDGNGGMRDSDPAVSEDTYVFNADGKQLPDENLPELVGKPYPLYNWCIAFNMKAEPVGK